MAFDRGGATSSLRPDRINEGHVVTAFTRSKRSLDSLTTSAMKRTLLTIALTAGGAVGTAQADVQRNYDDALDNPLVTPWSKPKATY